VHIYRWIEGHDLHDRCHKLSAAAVADIGGKLAAALILLHKHEIVHRDIRPANIILETGTNEPVLIDFGVARAFSDDSRTSFDSPFTPTEVRTGESGWGPEGDIYSLGKTLDELLASNDRQRSTVYRRVIAPCLDSRSRRPSAQRLVELLEQLSQEINLNATKHEAEQRIDELVRADIDHAWYWNRLVQMKFQKAFTSMALGVHPDVWDKLPHFADFLNQILEAAPPPFNEMYGNFARLNLSLICSEQLLPPERARLRQKLHEADPNRKGLEALNALRNDRSHGGRGSDRADRAIRLFRDLSSSTQAASVCALFKAVGQVLGLSSPALLAREFLLPAD
jgi:serine/threonine protein kinase